MYDSVEATAIPVGWHPQLVAGYVNGRWPSFTAMTRRFPNAQAVSVTVNAGGDADVLDVETGNATPAQAPGWVGRQHAMNRPRPTIYCSRSTVPAVERAMRDAGVPVDRYDYWVADWGPKPSAPIFDAVAVQYVDHGPAGENVDISVVFDPTWPRQRKGAPMPDPETDAQAQGHEGNVNVHVAKALNTIAAMLGYKPPIAGADVAPYPFDKA